MLMLPGRESRVRGEGMSVWYDDEIDDDGRAEKGDGAVQGGSRVADEVHDRPAGGGGRGGGGGGECGSCCGPVVWGDMGDGW